MIKKMKHFYNKEVNSHILSNNKSFFYKEDYITPSIEKNYAGIDIMYCWECTFIRQKEYNMEMENLFCLIYERKV